MPNSPLAGARVVVTSPTGSALGLSKLLEDAGATVLPLPMFEISEPASWEQLDGALGRLDDFAWILFTSRNGVSGFLGRLGNKRLPKTLKVAAVGSATAAALEQARISSDLVPQLFTGCDLADELGPPTGSVLLVRVEDGPPGTPTRLRERGWHVTEVASYRNVPLDLTAEEAAILTGGEIDAVTLMSPSAVRGLVRALAGDLLPEGVAVVCIGPSTARAASAEDISVHDVATRHTAEGVREALTTAMSDLRKMAP